MADKGKTKKDCLKKVGGSQLNDLLMERLMEEPNYVSDDGKVKKWVVAEEARNYSPTLITLLLKDEKLRGTFFTEVAEATVFKMESFLHFIEQKNYLSDSYTRYSQKIGLQIGGRFMNQRNEVELVFPFKDCILEGGQTKDDQKRKEIFFNQTLAQDEITQLLEPKVLTNAVRYDADGEHPVETVLPEDNLIIRGNNLLALSSLKRVFYGKVKLIYIDPPYYFKNNPSTDTFKYNSSFHLSSWLVFMRNRLQIAKELLKEGGTIWINISEDGMHYLKVMADDIFGSNHFVGTLPRRTRSGKSDVPYNFSQDFDWLLVYTNVSNDVEVMGRSVERTYYTTPDYPGKPWRLADLTKQTTAKERQNSFFTMVNPKTGKEYPASEKRTWAITKDTFQHYYDIGYIVFPDDYDFLKITKPYGRKFKYEDDAKGKLSAVISDFQIADFLKSLLTECKNEKGNTEIDLLFGRDEFDYAKPENLIRAILSVATSENDIVLDFFSGSGTTAAVAHKMNRQYIACEQIDHQVDINVRRLKEVIDGDKGGVSDEVNWRGGGSFVYLELKRYNQRFIDEIEKAQTTNEMLKVWEQMKARAFFRFNVKMQEFEDDINGFNTLSIEEQKQALCSLLDMNQLYVNYSDMDDTESGVTEEEKRITKAFYGEE